jgi:cytochrome P460
MDALPNIVTTGADTRIQFPRTVATERPPQKARKDDPTHATALGFAYVNELGRDAFKREPFAFAVGTILVRERLLPPATIADQLVVMIKREPRFNKNGNGWEFLTLSGDATRILKREKDGKCLKCHASAISNDFVFPEPGEK